MSRDSSFSRLFRLIDDALRPYTDMQKPEVVCSTKDKEKDLLIALSQVWREIQLMKQELDCDSDEDEDSESDGDKKSSEEAELQHEYHNCSTEILATLMILLTVESQFVQHLVGNILVVVSEFVAQAAKEWDSFISSLFICLKLAISNVLPCSLATSRDQKGDSSSLVVLRARLKNANWSTVGAIVRVLRCTLKYLKQEGDDQLLETFTDCVSSFLLDVPWDVMEEIQVDHGSDAKESSSLNSCFTETKFVFLGNFIQFLCSLVEQSCPLEAKVGAQDNHSFPCVIVGFVPRILRLFLGKQGNCANLSISLYFRHKLLMLMLRLSYHTCLGYSTLISWLQLLHEYYEEFLHKPIIQLDISQDEFLEGSPFLASLSDGGVKRFSSSHLQRWGILLFLRCCFSLISLTGDIREQCACATPNSCSTFNSISEPTHARKTGFLELCEWLQGHLPSDISMAREMYLENCIGFSSSFLQLYMHEDDVLFEVLLQLLSIQSSLEQLSKAEKWAFENVNKDILFQALSMFNPVHLFHLFLAALHYDHQVILDYLISKDTGASCAEYLLRSLRVVCNSWSLFITFSVHEKLKNPSSCKKRKLLLDGSNVQAEVSSVPSEQTLSPGLEKHEKDVERSWKHDESTRQMFKEAKNCLLSLKYSVENLHRKNLFPYNPEALLRRLTKFQELCLM
ncbi:uncharacterized protein [Euphorbia lathyris]|uniref:uncharacterized protein isoform X2 n=1 Tax=Euphorbia lathyris TaxID=212925 RepID=UPI003313A280